MATNIMRTDLLTQLLKTYRINIDQENTTEFLRSEWARFTNIIKEETYKQDWHKKDVIKAYKDLRDQMVGDNIGLKVHMVDGLEDLFKAKTKKLMKNIDTVVNEIIKAEDITPNIILESKHIGNILNEQLKDIDLFNTKLLLVSPTGTGKSTAVAGLNVENMVIFKGELALIDNAKTELEKDMKAGIIPTKEIVIFTGKSRPNNILKDGYWFNKPNQIILSTFNQVGRLDNLLNRKSSKCKWLYILDESHKLVTNEYRAKTLAEIEYILRKKKGYIATTATPKTYCPLKYTKRIEIAKKDYKLNSEVRIYTNKDTDLEKVLIDTMKSTKKVFCLYFENKTDNLIYLKDRLVIAGSKAEVINSEIYQDDVEHKGTVAYNIKRGKTGADCILSTCLLMEGFSMNSEEYDEVHYFLKGNPGRELGHSLEIIQGAARLRGAKKIVIHLARPKKEEDKYKMDTLKIKAAEFKFNTIEANPEAYNQAAGLIGLVNNIQKQLTDEPNNQEFRDSFKFIKNVSQPDIFVLSILKDYTIGQITNTIEQLEVIETPIMAGCKNYDIDKAIELASDKLLKHRLSKAGHSTFIEIDDRLNYSPEEIETHKEAKAAQAEAKKKQLITELKAIEDLDGYFKEVFSRGLKVSKLKMKVVFNIYWLMNIGFTREETFKILEDNSFSQTENLINQENLNMYLYKKYVTEQKAGYTIDSIQVGNLVRGVAKKELETITDMTNKIGILEANQVVREDELTKKGMYGRLRVKLIKLYDLDDSRKQVRVGEARIESFTIKGWKLGIEETINRAKDKMAALGSLEDIARDFDAKRKCYEELPETMDVEPNEIELIADSEPKIEETPKELLKNLIDPSENEISFISEMDSELEEYDEDQDNVVINTIINLKKR